MATEYNTGDLELQDAVGTVGEDVYQIYEFDIPAGAISRINVRMENYMVIHFNDPLSGWSVYTSDPNGTEKHLIGSYIPNEGGGGYPTPPDCWFISDDPAVLADLTSGQTNYIKLISFDVGPDDWLTFNDIEVIIDYDLQPGLDTINRYYVKYDLSQFQAGDEIDSAVLNLYVNTPGPDAAANISLVDSDYDSQTGAFSIYNAEDADYSSLINPFKNFSCTTAGPKQVNVKAALEDALAAGESHIAFLVTEKDENALFDIDGSAGSNPPVLDVHLNSGISSGAASWNIVPNTEGQYTLHIAAHGSTGVTGISQDVIISIVDPNKPIINSIDCMINSVWDDCSALYDDNLQKIRINSTDPQGDTPDVNLTLKNVSDDHTFVDSPVSNIASDYIYDTNLTIEDSGQWQITVTSTDSDDNTTTETLNWNVPWGQLQGSVTIPAGDITVAKSDSFDLSGTVECLNGECPDAKVTLRLNEPIELSYDDGSAEDYGDIGTTSGYLAVKITPSEYPSQVKTARFYIWDATAYPFELHVWDDNGGGGLPGTNLITPFTVDPVVASDVQDVKWFDIDLSSYNITITSGSFYIGFRQLYAGQVNQVGFDTDGPGHYRTWGYLDFFGWFNLNDFCGFDPQYCGNLMIRAIMNTPSSYSDDMPDNPSSGPFYTLDEHPCVIGEMKADDISAFGFNIKAVGAISEITSISSIFSNNYSYGIDEGFKASITSPGSLCDASNLDAFGVVNLNDLALLSGQWQSSASPLTADINDNGTVDLIDLAIMANYWLSDCQ
jgi:hypothetical protein